VVSSPLMFLLVRCLLESVGSILILNVVLFFFRKAYSGKVTMLSEVSVIERKLYV
jgi:hypothetical protein